MDNVTHLGLDVHKETIAVGLLRPQDPVPDYRVIDNTPEAVRKLVSKTGTASSLSPATRPAPPATTPTACSSHWAFAATSSRRR